MNSMKIKNLIKILPILIIMLLFISLTSCNNYKMVEKIQIKDDQVINVEAGDFNYEGIKVIITYTDGKTSEIDLTEDMIPDAEKLNFYKMGEHEISVVYKDKYVAKMKINVIRHEFDDIYKLEDYTCTYDGMPHRIDINYELPEGAKIEYPNGNTFTNAGEYEVIGVISKNGYNAKTLKATLKIEAAEHNLDEVKFENKEYVYDGTSKSLEAIGVPKNVDVSYTIYDSNKTVRLNNATNAGEYIFVAHFSSADTNYKQIPDMEAKLTINKASYDMSKVALDDFEKTYDGKEFNAKLVDKSALPNGVEVSFDYYNEEGQKVDSNANAGEYKVVASFKSNNQNYEKIENLESKLIVNKELVNIDGKVEFNTQTVNFDREEHNLKVEGTLPDDVKVTYENNGQIAAGEYKVIAKFECENQNRYLDLEELDAYLIINKIREEVMVIDPDSGERRPFTENDFVFVIEHDTGFKNAYIQGFDHDTYETDRLTYHDLSTDKEVSVDDFKDGGSYSYHLEVAFTDDVQNSSVLLAPISGIFNCSIEFEGAKDFKLENDSVTYDGNSHTLTFNGIVPDGTDVTYEIYSGENKVDEAINAGEYYIKAIISKEDYKTVILSATLTIEKATYDMSSFDVENIEKTYDNAEYEPDFELPQGVIITDIKTYILVNEEWIETISNKNVGEYKIILSFEGDEINYNPIEDIEFGLKITKKMLDLSNITLEGFSISIVASNYYTYPQFALISGTPNNNRIPIWEIEKSQIKRSTDLPEVVNVSYTYTAKSNIMYGTTVLVEKDKTVFEIDEAGNIVAQAQDQNNNPITSPKFEGIYGVVATFSLTDTNYEIDETQLTLTADVVVKVADY